MRRKGIVSHELLPKSGGEKYQSTWTHAGDDDVDSLVYQNFCNRHGSVDDDSNRMPYPNGSLAKIESQRAGFIGKNQI